MVPLVIYDFYSGTGSSTQAFEDAGHTVIRFELDKQFEAHDYRDIGTLDAAELIATYGRPDFIWASPPCTTFSVASIGKYWASGGDTPVPKHPKAEQALELVANTLALIYELSPTYGWIMENPRGMLRKTSVVKMLPRHTVTYCQYGDTRQKPTDLWGYVSQWMPRPACKAGANCHVSAPRGSRTGTQGIDGAKERSRVPYALGLELMECIHEKLPKSQYQ